MTDELTPQQVHRSNVVRLTRLAEYRCRLLEIQQLLQRLAYLSTGKNEDDWNTVHLIVLRWTKQIDDALDALMNQVMEGSPDMPWCDHCQGYHHSSARCIDKKGKRA